VAAIRIIELSRRAHARAWDVALLVCAVGHSGAGTRFMARGGPGVLDSSPRRLRACCFGSLGWGYAISAARPRPELHARRELRLLLPAAIPSGCILLLYVLFGADQIIRAGVLLWNREAFGGLAPRDRAAPGEPTRLSGVRVSCASHHSYSGGVASSYAQARRVVLSASRLPAPQMNRGSVRVADAVVQRWPRERVRNRQ